MLKTIRSSNIYFGEFLFEGKIDTYSGYLNPDNVYRYDDMDEDEASDYEDDFSLEDYLIRVNGLLKEFFENTVFDRYFKSLGFTKLTFDKLYRPSQYNYYGDHVEFDLEYDTDYFDEKYVIQYLNDCRGGDYDVLIEKWLDKAYSSYPGFVSFVPNNICDLIADLEENNVDKKNNAMNAFIAAYLYQEIENGNIKRLSEDDLFYNVVENLQ